MERGKNRRGEGRMMVRKKGGASGTKGIAYTERERESEAVM